MYIYMYNLSYYKLCMCVCEHVCVFVRAGVWVCVFIYTLFWISFAWCSCLCVVCLFVYVSLLTCIETFHNVALNKYVLV